MSGALGLVGWVCPFRQASIDLLSKAATDPGACPTVRVGCLLARSAGAWLLLDL